jgi:hypothetical protein
MAAMAATIHNPAVGSLAVVSKAQQGHSIKNRMAQKHHVTARQSSDEPERGGVPGGRENLEGCVWHTSTNRAKHVVGTS